MFSGLNFDVFDIFFNASVLSISEIDNDNISDKVE